MTLPEGVQEMFLHSVTAFRRYFFELLGFILSLFITVLQSVCHA